MRFQFKKKKMIVQKKEEEEPGTNQGTKSLWINHPYHKLHGHLESILVNNNFACSSIGGIS